ncbi:hypothetical protein [Bifidobacterium eulemuris]|uniref:Uncharacterized protein n=1 Tax=Bifidobacterium eulemuris TaxID=1765219 RepID=A0A261GAK6_9BIFI|nr:hypothetical protein [Bifidobacterium eulemuris]OZG68215.1 hypothetical protein BEUL_1228 [Bifidobacterium eulemuris]QOL31728.1 hypothetical protein BE0216_04050 [Bifidobacterium eulemuris]
MSNRVDFRCAKRGMWAEFDHDGEHCAGTIELFNGPNGVCQCAACQVAYEDNVHTYGVVTRDADGLADEFVVLFANTTGFATTAEHLTKDVQNLVVWDAKPEPDEPAVEPEEPEMERIEDWEQVREGDIVHFFRDSEPLAKLSGPMERPLFEEHWCNIGGQHVSKHWVFDYALRPKTTEPDTPAMPTEPGLYKDKDGDVWILDQAKDWYLLGGAGGWASLDNRRHHVPIFFAPFTRIEVD